MTNARQAPRVSWDIVARKKTGPQRGPVSLARASRIARPISPAAPMPPMPAMMPAVAVPAHFGRDLLRTFLNRRGGAGGAQRQRLGPLSRGGQDEQCADGRKPQNLHHVHMYPP